jgi:hypothetical protein
VQEMPHTSEVHLSPQVARSDISSTEPDEYSVLSIFSHAVLNDTGWYRTVREPEPLLWGLGRNETFLEETPKRNNSAASVCSPCLNGRCCSNRSDYVVFLSLLRCHGVECRCRQNPATLMNIIRRRKRNVMNLRAVTT